MARFFIRIHRTNNRESKSIQLYKITFSKCAISPAQYSVIKSLTAFTIAWMHMHLDAYACTWMHIHLDAHTCTCMHIHLYAHTLGCTCTWMHIHLDAHALVCTYTWMHMHLDARTLVCTYTWMHMHLGKKLWVQTFSQISHTVALFSSRGSEGMYFRCLSAKRVF